MKKNIIITILSIILISTILILINNFIYGIDTIYIADYMPSGEVLEPSLLPIKELEKEEPPFMVTAIKNLFFDMIIAALVGIIIATIERKILYKKNIFEKNKKDKILVLLIYIIPIVVSAIRLFMLYGYTC